MARRHRQLRLMIWLGWPVLVAILAAGAFLYMWLVLQWTTIAVRSYPPYALWANAVVILLMPPRDMVEAAQWLTVERRV